VPAGLCRVIANRASVREFSVCGGATVTRVLRVLVADDHAPTRAGVRVALERGGCEVCAEVANALDAVAAAVRERPDACLIELGMRGGGLAAVAGIAARLPETVVLVLTVSASPDDFVDALRAGAAGYLLKEMEPAQLPVAVRRAVAGEAALPGVLTARLIEQVRRLGRRGTLALEDGRSVELTPREWLILGLLADGHSTARMAQGLFVSPVTVRRHVSALLHKLGVPSREEARRLIARQVPPANRRSRRFKPR
jgi:DNA-binding NarL/FixJ family response regulator